MILPKFEIGELAGDFPGEAQYFYEEYLTDSDIFEINGVPDANKLYILNVGCGGAAKDYGIFGDVFVISAAVDFDLGHQADARVLGNKDGTTWFHDESYDGSAVVRLDQRLTDHVYDMVKDIPLETTENTVDFLKREYPGEAWAQRQPQLKF